MDDKTVRSYPVQIEIPPSGTLYNHLCFGNWNMRTPWNTYVKSGQSRDNKIFLFLVFNKNSCVTMIAFGISRGF